MACICIFYEEGNFLDFPLSPVGFITMGAIAGGFLLSFQIRRARRLKE